MDPAKRGWAGFGAYALGGELARERPLRLLEARLRGLTTGTVPASDESEDSETPRPESLAQLRDEWRSRLHELYSALEPWETVTIARHAQRPIITDYIEQIVEGFVELHGDRYYGDDPAIVTGFGTIGDRRVMLIGHNRGRDAAERTACGFGCARPEGYRKALAKMQLAAKFGVPIVTLIDTPGAFPGAESEERGIARAIAMNLAAMSRFRVPIVSVVTGEGGSGGALGIGVADSLAMLEHSIYSVISPEGCAAILWRTGRKADEAAAALRLQAKDLLPLGMIDEIIPEPTGGAHRDHAATAQSVKQFILGKLDGLVKLSADQLLARRAARLRTIGSLFAS